MLLGRNTCRNLCVCKRYLSNGNTKPGYYVLIPELPTDTPDTNSLLRLDGLPEFTKITGKNVITGCSKLALEYEVEFGNITDKLSAGDSSFGTIFGAIEAHLAPLSCALRLAEHLKNVDERFQDPFWRVSRQVMKAKSSRWNNEQLYRAISNNLSSNKHLSSIEKRLCEHYILQCQRNGLDLTDSNKKSLLAAESNIEKEQGFFRECSVRSQNLFEQMVDSKSVFGNAPRSLYRKLSLNPLEPSKGPWKVTIQPDVYFDLLRFCEDGQLRWSIWHAWVNRGSSKHMQENLSNHKRIGTIRSFARERANIFGYKTAADMETAKGMAADTKTVFNALEKANEKIGPIAKKNIEELCKFSNSSKLQPWDIPFWRQKMADHMYGKDLEAEDNLVPLEAALSGVFSMVEHLYGVKLERLPPHASQPWHPNVAVYRAVDIDYSNRVLGYLYLDLFSRPETGKCAGNWISLGREPSALLGCSPLSFVVMNLPKPLAGQPAFVSPSNLLELVRLIGSSLPHLLCHNEFSEISSGLLVEPDYSPVSGHFLRFFVSDIKENLRQICPTLNENQLDAAFKSNYHCAAIDTQHQLFLSAFDQGLHDVNNDHWMEVMKDKWKVFLKDIIPFVEKVTILSMIS